MSTKFKKKMFCTSCVIIRFQRLQTVDSDKVAQYEPPNLDLHCLQIKLFSFFYVLREPNDSEVISINSTNVCCGTSADHLIGKILFPGH